MLRVENAVLARGARSFAGDARAGYTVRISTLRVGAGERIALCGPSGVGKSVTLDFLALLLRPAEVGCYELNAAGRRYDLRSALLKGELDRLAPMRAGVIGYSMQSADLIPFLNVRDNALLPDGARLAVQGERENAIDTLARRFDLYDALDKNREALSGGQRKRLSLIRTLCSDPDLLLADEPSAGLDAAMADAVFESIAAHADRGDAACIIATHDRDRAERAGFSIVEFVTDGAAADHEGRKAEVRYGG